LVAPDSLFGCWGNNADPYYGGGYYAQMLQVVYPRIKAVDPTAQVLVGGLLLDCDPRPATYGCSQGNPKTALFLEGILRNGGGAYFDGVAFHAYEYTNLQLGVGIYVNPNWHSDTTTGPVSNIKASFIRSVLSAYGVSGKFLMNTEAALLCVQCDYNPNYEMTKAYYVAQLYAASVAIDLRAATWYRVFGWPDRSSALLDTNLSARPAYTAYQVISTMMAGESYIGEITAADIGGSPNVRGYKFQRGNQSRWVVWSADAAAHTIHLANAPQSIQDVFGNTLVVADPKAIDLTSPNRLLVYLTWTH
jgi:hypothetical protein